MKESFWAYLFIILGLFTIVVMMLIQDVTTTDEENYYLTKEVMEAAMIDSIDYGVYMDSGDIRIIESKFVENFTRRFAESVKDSKSYTLEFYEIYEEPPKATVKVSTSTKEYTVTKDTTTNFDILTVLSGILETKYNKGDKALNVSLNVKNGRVGSRLKYTNYNGAVTFDVVPDFPYIIDNDSVSCTPKNVKISSDDKTITIGDVTDNTTCTASLVKAPYQVTLKVLNGAVSSGKKVIAVRANGGATYEVVAFDGYTLDDPYMSCSGGATISRNSNIFTVSKINATQECTVTLRKAPYKVTFNIDNGGTTVGNPVLIRQGETGVVPIYANIGYTTEGMTVSCDGGANATIANDTVINVSNVLRSQICTVKIKKITSGSYPSFKSNGNGTYDITIANVDGKTDNMKTTYAWGGYTTVVKSGNSQTNFTKDVNGGQQEVDGLVISISASNVGGALAVTYTIKNKTASTKPYSIGSHADIYLISNDHVNLYKDSQDKMHTAEVVSGSKRYSIDYLFDPAVTSSWVGHYSDRQRNIWTNSGIGSQTGGVDSGMAFSWSGNIGPYETITRTVKFVINKK